MTENNLNVTILGKENAVEVVFSLSAVTQSRFTSAISLTHVFHLINGYICEFHHHKSLQKYGGRGKKSDHSYYEP